MNIKLSAFAAASALTALGAGASGFLAKTLTYPKMPSYEECLETERKSNYLRNYDPSKSERYKVQSFDGYLINTELIRTASPLKKYVILSHGYSYNRLGSIKYTHLFLSLGFNCIIYDMRGHGENERFPCSFGVTESRDLLALIDDAYDRFGDDIFLGLHGESMGSALSATALSKKPKVKFAVLDCGYAEFRNVIEHELKNRRLPKSILYPTEMFCRLLYGVSILKSKPYTGLFENEVPLCIIHGDKDELVTVENAYKLKNANKGYSELHIFENAGHAQCFLSDEKRYLDILSSFIEKAEGGSSNE